VCYLKNLIPVEAVQERDIDLLFLEEVISNVNFRDWLLEQFKQKPESFKFLGVWHSLSQVGLGECDLAFKCRGLLDYCCPSPSL
jgi:hypothetical protein